MAVRTAILTSRNINKDTDFSKFIETVSDPGVIKGLEVSTTKVAVGQAWVPCERTNGETIYSLVQNCSELTISGNGYVVIQIDQTIIDNGGGNEDGTGIATISVVNALPSKNYLLLAEINNGIVTDRRNMLPTLGDITTQVNSLLDRMTQAEIDIQELEEKGAIDHLEETGLVWEKYTLSNTLFKQATPTLANSTIDCNVGDVAANKQIHVQRITSKTASNSIKLKVKKVWAPTTWLVVEVRNATKVDVSNTEAYWYGGGSLICSGSIAYTAISTDYQEITVPLNGTFGGVQGQLVDVVVYQTGNIVNSTNYYVLACDSTQYSEAFSYVSVNGDTRTRSKLMPYCLSDWFAQYLLSKVKNSEYTLNKNYSQINSNSDLNPNTFYVEESGYYSIQYKLYTNDNYTYGHVITSANEGQLASQQSQPRSRQTLTRSGNLTAGDTLTFSHWGVTIIASQLIINYTVSYAPIPVVKYYLDPLELKTLWELAKTFLYWIDPKDNIYKWGIILWNSSSATTGSITLWNAVGFLVVNYNWNLVKIPYYT